MVDSLSLSISKSVKCLSNFRLLIYLLQKWSPNEGDKSNSRNRCRHLPSTIALWRVDPETFWRMSLYTLDGRDVWHPVLWNRNTVWKARRKESRNPAFCVASRAAVAPIVPETMMFIFSIESLACLLLFLRCCSHI